jgi:hypothetical protein
MDANAIDPIVDLPGAYEVMRSSVNQERLGVLFTHITIDELAATPDEDRRSRLLLLLVDLGRLIPTGARVLGFSRLNYARFGDDEEAFGSPPTVCDPTAYRCYPAVPGSGF